MSYKDIPARPTLYNGIRMRSRLEADFAAFLDGRGDKWEYEPGCFASSSGQWLPDFRIADEAQGPVYVEVKPYGFIAEWQSTREFYRRVNALMRKMEIVRESEPKSHLWLMFWEYGGTEMALLLSHYADPCWMASIGPFLTMWPPVEIQDALEPQPDASR